MFCWFRVSFVVSECVVSVVELFNVCGCVVL